MAALEDHAGRSSWRLAAMLTRIVKCGAAATQIAEESASGIYCIISRNLEIVNVGPCWVRRKGGDRGGEGANQLGHGGFGGYSIPSRLAGGQGVPPQEFLKK
ncbi:hypothetical protein J6590_004658 [Homalodisca vitripennis]|nr:hypothetical protein J6590_004658 [Homalodisca vitripennis]